MATYHLHKWFVTGSIDPYLAPEAKANYLAGYRNGDKKLVRTSQIVKIEGRKITTYSGSVYILEDIDPSYLTWMADNGHKYNYDNPIIYKNNER